MESGKEIFDRLQHQQNRTQEIREAAAAQAALQWRNLLLEMLTKYREALPMLLERCEGQLTRIVVIHSRQVGRFNKRWVQDDEHLVGWYISARNTREMARGDYTYDSYTLFWLHSGKFFEINRSYHPAVDGPEVRTSGEIIADDTAIDRYFADRKPVEIAEYASAERVEDYKFASAQLGRPPVRVEYCFTWLFRQAGLSLPSLPGPIPD